MKLFKFENWELTVSEETWGLAPFSKLLKRDKTKNKERANAEVLFIYLWCDIKSDYLAMSEEDRLSELKKDIAALPDKWEMDDTIKEAINFYNKFETVIERLYKRTLKAADDVGEYLGNTKELLAERDANDRVVNDISKITAAIDRVPKLMSNLKAAYKEVVKEMEDTENKKKGSKKFNIFEEGLT